jgi:hypothetical protein
MVLGGYSLSINHDLQDNQLIFSYREKVAPGMYSHRNPTEVRLIPTEKPYTILDWLEIQQTHTRRSCK